MSMKKKFLALALAGAVAMPVVANASNNVQYGTAGGNATQTHTSDLIVNGTVDRKDGTAAAGRIQVELPTQMSFSVDKAGTFTGPSNFEIRNTGSEAVKVDVIKFIEGDASGGIEIVSESDLSNPSSKTRDKVSIVLNSSNKKVDLNAAKTSVQTLCDRIAGQDREVISIAGKAGTDISTSTSTIETQGANEEFTVKFQISHVQ